MATLTEEPANAAAQTPVANDAVWNRAIATHAALLANPTRLAAVLANPNSPSLKTNWYSRFKDRGEAVAWLQQNTQVRQTPGTALIEVSVRGDVEPKDSAIIVNDIASRYLEDIKRRDSDKLVAQVSLLQNLKSRYDNQVHALKLQIAEEVAASSAAPATQPAAKRLQDERIDTMREELDAYKAFSDRFRSQLDAINVAITQNELATIMQVVYAGEQAAR
jgi:hypothetical protein